MEPEATVLEDAIRRKARESARTNEAFFDRNAAALEACARAVAERLKAGGRVISFGNGGSACDAAHVAVEFLHPVIAKRPAFPAFSLATDAVTLTAVANDRELARVFSDPLRLLARAGDVALGISTSGHSSNVIRALQAARELGLLTIGLTGKDGGRLPEVAEHCFVVESHSIHRIQEAHVTFLHVLWDAVHLSLGAEDVL